MRVFREEDKDHGKEAFAYLAIILMTLTTFYVSYQISLERDMDRELRNESMISDMRMYLDKTLNSVKIDLISLHDALLIRAEKELIESPNLTRLDHLLEGVLIDRLEFQWIYVHQWLQNVNPSIR